jgi:hypothetical protein
MALINQNTILVHSYGHLMMAKIGNLTTAESGSQLMATVSL